ncbi:MAG: hypothetical protein DLM68_12230 [Hyphomicrobiales bacterium]|nr:MAG: hypothetical protein DLM68_12230 [Hyphomicrobiales bacterium]
MSFAEVGKIERTKRATRRNRRICSLYLIRITQEAVDRIEKSQPTDTAGAAAAGVALYQGGEPGEAGAWRD